MKLLLKKTQDIQNAKRLNKLFNRPYVEEVTIELGLNPIQKRAIEDKVLDLFNECGCKWGSIGLILPFFSSVTILSILYPFQWKFLLWALGISILASALAKIAGLLLSHIKLGNILDQLERTEAFKSTLKTENHGSTM
ncbi:hypothetical protein [Flagellimonas olearia]|uniref:Uncharacterized protein n=1 Tax=Flagellimonas olearia TaxID=552546 RepID=A0A444VI01_9FLAO|nr:hypothetical protein [Allomuricauda olearia]RYC50373.1 hypothetical protein DN53_05465 [Allomuricauda olearia]